MERCATCRNRVTVDEMLRCVPATDVDEITAVVAEEPAPLESAKDRKGVGVGARRVSAQNMKCFARDTADYAADCARVSQDIAIAVTGQPSNYKPSASA